MIYGGIYARTPYGGRPGKKNVIIITINALKGTAILFNVIKNSVMKTKNNIVITRNTNKKAIL